jgi:hypothetical protein
MPCVGFEPMIPASERAKTVHALDSSATVTGNQSIENKNITCFSIQHQLNLKCKFLRCSNSICNKYLLVKTTGLSKTPRLLPWMVLQQYKGPKCNYLSRNRNSGTSLNWVFSYSNCYLYPYTCIHIIALGKKNSNKYKCTSCCVICNCILWTYSVWRQLGCSFNVPSPLMNLPVCAECRNFFIAR